jgi:hypothetical protein
VNSLFTGKKLVLQTRR